MQPFTGRVEHWMAPGPRRSLALGRFRAFKSKPHIRAKMTRQSTNSMTNLWTSRAKRSNTARRGASCYLFPSSSYAREASKREITRSPRELQVA